MNAEDDNKKLRELLWLRHGCSISSLYGDDGEMQCGHCLIDFKRLSALEIEEAFIQMNMRRFVVEVQHEQSLSKDRTS